MPRATMRPEAFCIVALGLLTVLLSALSAQARVPAWTDLREEAPKDSVTLSGEPAQGRFAAGVQVRIDFTVTNSGAKACALTSEATGALTVTAVSRDGKALTPVLSPRLYQDGLGSVTSRGLARVATGGHAHLSLESTDTGRTGLTGGLPSVTWSEESGSLEAWWPVGTPGRYEVTAVYAYPRLPSHPPDVCPGMSRPVTVAFTVGDTAPTSWRPVLWTVLGGMAVAGVVVVPLFRSRRRPPTSAGLVLLATLSVGALVLGTAPRAWAVFSVDGAAAVAFGRCMSTYRAEDGSGDPLGIVRELEFSPHKVRIVLNNGTPQNPGDTSTAPAGDFWPPASNGRGTGSVISWNSKATGPLSDGTAQEACAQLYHEMAHARDMAHGTLNLGRCQGAPGIQTDEVVATSAENAYRRFRGLPLRTTYGGVKLPGSVDDCKRPEEKPQKFPGKPRPAGTECPARGCAGSNGDPHLTTFDELRYDFQAAGEFTAVQSTVDDLRIQVRQVPYPGSTLVSVNKAVAMNVAGDRVGLYLSENGIDVRVNGKLRQVPDGDMALPHGGGVSRISADDLESYEVTWPDGSFLATHVVGTWGLNVHVRLASDRKGEVRGLFGDFDGEPGRDLRARDGTPLPDSPSFDRLYRTFGDSWRVRNADSLFDYDIGENTGTFTVRDFPERPITLDSVPNQAIATMLCQAAGVTAGPRLDECVIDAAVTGQASFVVSAAATPETVGGPALVRDGDLVTGDISAPGQVRRYRLDLGGAESFAVADWRGTSDACDQTFTVDLVGVSGNNFPCTGGHAQFTVPDPARAYELEISSPGKGTGPYRFRLITVKPRTLATATGRGVVGALDVRGRVDRHEFDAAGAAAVRLVALPGCEANMFADLADVTSGTLLSGNNALCGSQVGPVRLPEPTHRYAVVIRSGDLRIGPYSFRLEAGG
ncbi:VWD domain-containing protein [Streptomyces sp. NPDC023588]|uniref:VWD domain-containing protein n=1 Tax=Streptomyces sp. NPDC023588 TaxID=3154907 RepID=UPI0033CCAAB4